MLADSCSTNPPVAALDPFLRRRNCISDLLSDLLGREASTGKEACRNRSLNPQRLHHWQLFAVWPGRVEVCQPGIFRVHLFRCFGECFGPELWETDTLEFVLRESLTPDVRNSRFSE